MIAVLQHVGHQVKDGKGGMGICKGSVSRAGTQATHYLSITVNTRKEGFSSSIEFAAFVILRIPESWIVSKCGSSHANFCIFIISIISVSHTGGHVARRQRAQLTAA